MECQRPGEVLLELGIVDHQPMAPREQRGCRPRVRTWPDEGQRGSSLVHAPEPGERLDEIRTGDELVQPEAELVEPLCGHPQVDYGALVLTDAEFQQAELR